MTTITDIIWDIEPDDIIGRLDEMTGKEIADTLNIPPEKYMDITRNGLYAMAKTGWRKDQPLLNKIMGLPDEVTVPDGIDTDDAISDWLSDTYNFCHRGFRFKEEPKKEDKPVPQAKKYVLKLDNSYFGGPHEKYADMFNFSGSGAIGAKQYTKEKAEELRDYYEKNGWGVTIEEYDPKRYLKEELEGILRYETLRRNGKDVGYAIKNTAEHCLKYLEQID